MRTSKTTTNRTITNKTISRTSRTAANKIIISKTSRITTKTDKLTLCENQLLQYLQELIFFFFLDKKTMQ